MKKIVSVVAALALSLPAFAAMEHGSTGHGGMDHGSMGASQSKGQARMGKKVGESKSEGYKFEYYVIEMKEMMKTMPMKDMDMSKMKSHHLMVYVTSPGGKPIEEGKVGYRIQGPAGEVKVMAGPMTGGFGADVDLKEKGAYKISTKALAGEKTVSDEFTYTAK
ncbi:MAG: hypothetical protein HY900_32775 [Deltaproteobacteria bacterium]|nr:hypothetical protein [Deltaproteobacteria bacterium]